MKLILDFDDPDVASKLDKAVEEHVGKFTSDKVNEIIGKIVQTKLERLTKVGIDEILYKVLKEYVYNTYFVKGGWSDRSFVEGEIRKLLVDTLADHYSKK